MHAAENALTRECAIGFPVPILFMIFHKCAAIENNTRDLIRRPPSSSSKSPFESLTDKWDEEDGQVAVAAPPVAPTSHLPLPAEPIEGGGEVELPPIVAEGNLDDPPPEDEGQMPIPDWSSFDLGRCLRALKSERQPTVIKALKRLHMRWWHCSSSRMSSLLKAAGVSKSTLDLIPSVCAACKSCRAWQQPGHRSMTSSRLSTRFNEVVQFDLVFIEDKIVGHLIDEATKWSVVDVLENRETSTILSFITNRAFIFICQCPVMTMFYHITPYILSLPPPTPR